MFIQDLTGANFITPDQRKAEAFLRSGILQSAGSAGEVQPEDQSAVRSLAGHSANRSLGRSAGPLDLSRQLVDSLIKASSEQPAGKPPVYELQKNNTLLPRWPKLGGALGAQGCRP